MNESISNNNRRRRGGGLKSILGIISSPNAWRRGLAPRFIFVFIIGVSVGFALATLFHFPFDVINERQKVKNINKSTTKSTTIATPTLHSLQLHHNMNLNSSFADILLKSAEEMSARTLAQEVRILCWIMTYPLNHETKAFHVKTTWGRHCNTLVFASEINDTFFPAVKLNVPDGRVGLWAKTTEAFKYVHKNYKDQYDWVVKADDDTYVVIENLRKMLLPYKPFNGHYFGFHFKPHTPKGYASGGAGYVLSKEAVDRVVNYAFDNKHKDCPDINNTNAEDINIAKCLLAVNVSIGDSRDSHGRNRFFPFDIEDHVKPFVKEDRWWYTDYRYWPMKGGVDCCSDEVVSFHYVSPNRMYLLEFLIYHTRVFPVIHLATAEPITDPPTDPPTTTASPSTTKVQTNATTTTITTTSTIQLTTNTSISKP